LLKNRSQRVCINVRAVHATRQRKVYGVIGRIRITPSNRLAPRLPPSPGGSLRFGLAKRLNLLFGVLVPDSRIAKMVHLRNKTAHVLWRRWWQLAKPGYHLVEFGPLCLRGVSKFIKVFSHRHKHRKNFPDCLLNLLLSFPQLCGRFRIVPALARSRFRVVVALPLPSAVPTAVPTAVIRHDVTEDGK